MAESTAPGDADLLEALARVIRPYLGETMARSAVQCHYDKLDLDGRRLAVEDLETIIGRIGAGLNVFLGRETSARVVDELRRVAAPEGGQR